MNALAVLRAWELNPVLVKEMRQAVRSLLLLTVFCLLLAGLTLGSFLYLGLEVAMTRAASGMKQMAGPIYLALVSGGLQVALLLGGIATFFRAKQEREPGRADLLYITTLSPGRIVRGKWSASLAFAGTMVSLGLPFMVIAYFLRGVSFGDIALAFATLAGTALFVNIFAILVAVLPCSGGMKHLLFWPALVFGLFYAGPALVALTMMRTMVGGMGTVPDMTWYVVKSVLVAATQLGLMCALAIYCLAPPASNRAKGLRLTLTGLLLAWMGLVFVQSSAGWSVLVMVILELLLLVGLLFGLASGLELSRRVRREVPPHLAGRLWALFFFNGTLAALLWTVAAAALLQGWLAVCRVLLGAGMDPSFWSTAARVCLLLNGYFLVYALLAQALQQRLPRLSVTAALAVVLTVGVILPKCFIPLLTHDWTAVGFPLLGDLTACVWDTQRDRFLGAHLLFLLGAAALALGLSRARVAGALRAVQPLPPAAPPPLPADGKSLLP